MCPTALLWLPHREYKPEHACSRCGGATPGGREGMDSHCGVRWCQLHVSAFGIRWLLEEGMKCKGFYLEKTGCSLLEPRRPRVKGSGGGGTTTGERDLIIGGSQSNPKDTCCLENALFSLYFSCISVIKKQNKKTHKRTYIS